MLGESFFSEGDEVIVKSARHPIPMIIRQIYLNQNDNSVKYKCSWELFDGRISNTIYDESELETLKNSTI
ncbi:hypothetical protein [Marinoscillum pacificum]|uniref:hypothetical protein n=1 Tax=Marinoscillum pacificum TaxID=392723 RepID=UPI0021582440|nr:hypothetical protein [Marinoscillum pacificum]